MRLIRDYRRLPDSARRAAVAIGNFDALHPGHDAVLARVGEEAARVGAPSAVMTFEPHPRRFFAPDLPRLRLLSPVEKIRQLKARGVGIVYCLRFGAELAGHSAEAFVREVLHKALDVRVVVVGEDFAFGKDRGGDVHSLRALAEPLGIEITVVPTRRGEEGIYSSSAIRAHLARGEAEAAARLLGRAYAIDGHVQHGDARGRALGFPTINLALRDRFLPRFGVYAVRVDVEGAEALPLLGVANLGVRPTFNGEKPVLEVFLFGFQGVLYGERVRVELCRFLREERRFPTPAALQSQIALDVAEAQAYFEPSAAMLVRGS